MTTAQRICVYGEPIGACVGFSLSAAEMPAGAEADVWPVAEDDGSSWAWQEPDGTILITDGDDLMVWRTREAAVSKLAELDSFLKAEAARA